jgi:hypothetical protein
MTPNSPALDSRPLFELGIAYASKHHIPAITAEERDASVDFLRMSVGILSANMRN